MDQKPSIGRVVHFLPDDKEGTAPQAALVTHVLNDECVNLVTWNSAGTASTPSSVLNAATAPSGGSRWKWPARV